MTDYDTCDDCGRDGRMYPLFTGEERRGIRLPEDEQYCGDCAADHNVHTPEDMEDDELVAAIMDDSMGYASPKHAARHVADYRDGEDSVEEDGRKYGCWCERGSAVFKNDLDDLIESARRHWLIMSEDKREKLLERVAKWQDVEDDPAKSMGLSMAYPTL